MPAQYSVGELAVEKALASRSVTLGGRVFASKLAREVQTDTGPFVVDNTYCRIDKGGDLPFFRRTADIGRGFAVVYRVHGLAQLAPPYLVDPEMITPEKIGVAKIGIINTGNGNHLYLSIGRREARDAPLTLWRSHHSLAPWEAIDGKIKIMGIKYYGEPTEEVLQKELEELLGVVLGA